MDRTWLYGGLLFAGGVAVVSLVRRGPVIRKGDKLLLIGDSLAVGLAAPLGELARDKGVSYAHLGKVGSTVREWATDTPLNRELRARLAERPTVTLVSLGTNDEYLSRAAADAELPLLDNLLALIGGSSADYGWIGPPRLPRAGNGFAGAIQAKVNPGRYFHSEELQIPRAGDQLHPTVRGYCGWAGQIWLWLARSEPAASLTCR